MNPLKTFGCKFDPSKEKTEYTFGIKAIHHIIAFKYPCGKKEHMYELLERVLHGNQRKITFVLRASLARY